MAFFGRNMKLLHFPRSLRLLAIFLFGLLVLARQSPVDASRVNLSSTELSVYFKHTIEIGGWKLMCHRAGRFHDYQSLGFGKCGGSGLYWTCPGLNAPISWESQSAMVQHCAGCKSRNVIKKLPMTIMSASEKSFVEHSSLKSGGTFRRSSRNPPQNLRHCNREPEDETAPREQKSFSPKNPHSRLINTAVATEGSSKTSRRELSEGPKSVRWECSSITIANTKDCDQRGLRNLWIFETIIEKARLPSTITKRGRRSKRLHQILHDVERDVRLVLQCPPSRTAVATGRTETGSTSRRWNEQPVRRRLLARHWATLTVINVVVGGLGIACGGTALWWIAHLRKGRHRRKSDGESELPITITTEEAGLEPTAASPSPPSPLSALDTELGEREPVRAEDVVRGRTDTVRGGSGVQDESLQTRSTAKAGDDDRPDLDSHQEEAEDLAASGTLELSRTEEQPPLKAKLGLAADSRKPEVFFFRGMAAATGNFDENNRLGTGSFGTVYRGHIFDGRILAIKRVHPIHGSKTMEMQSAMAHQLADVSRLHHQHLVNMVGYSVDHDEMMLAYEYMPNGTLAGGLHDDSSHSSPHLFSSWKVRLRVALQAARGIEFLHTNAISPLTHRNIKSANLMFDSKGSVRVADFGLMSVIFPPPAASISAGKEAQSTAGSGPPGRDSKAAPLGREGRNSCNVIWKETAGALGYLDPEHREMGQLTAKSDVYSFGVVMLELLTGKRAIHQRNETHVSVVDYAIPSIDADDLKSILDPRMRSPFVTNEWAALKVWTEQAVGELCRRCVRQRGEDRPTMTEVVHHLEHAFTLCQRRHAPLPVFGTQLGSTSTHQQSPIPSPGADAGSSPSRLSPGQQPGSLNFSRTAAAAPSHAYLPRRFRESDDTQTIVSVEFEEEHELNDEAGESVKTDRAELGTLTSSQARIWKDFLHAINDDDLMEHYYSDPSYSFGSLDEFLSADYSFADAIELCSSTYATPLGTSMPRANDEGLATLTGAADARSAPASASGEYCTGGHPQREIGPRNELGSSSSSTTWRQRILNSLSRSTGLAGATGFRRSSGDRIAGEGSSSSRRYKNADDPFERSRGVSNSYLQPPLMHHGSVVAGFTNFGEMGPAEDVEHEGPPRSYDPLPPPYPSLESPALERFPPTAGPEGSNCQGRDASATLLLQRTEFDGVTGNFIDAIDIEEYLERYVQLEHAAAAPPVPHTSGLGGQDLQTLRRALYNLYAQQEQHRERRHEQIQDEY